MKALHPQSRQWMQHDWAAYLYELSQLWRCWSPSCEVVSETWSLCPSLTSQVSVSSHTHTYTLIHTQTHKVEITQFALPISCVSICLLLFLHVAFTSMFILVLIERCVSDWGAGLQVVRGVLSWLMLTKCTTCLHKWNAFHLQVRVIQRACCLRSGYKLWLQLGGDFKVYLKVAARADLHAAIQ